MSSLHRLIAIVLLLESRECIKARELAEALEVSKRTIHRDMEVLCESGVPITAIAGPNGGYSLVKGYTSNIKTLECDEILTLYLSGMGLHPNRYSEASTNLSNAILKLEKILPQQFASDIGKAKERFYFDQDHWWGAKPVLHHLDILRKGVMQSKKLNITYTSSSMGRNEIKIRTVQPYGLVLKNSDWYLVGFCENANSLRVFKCERITMVTSLEGTYHIPTTFQLKDYWEKWIKGFKEVLSEVPYYPVTLRLISISENQLEKMHIVEKPRGDKSVITVNLYSYRNACNTILDYRDAIEVMEPLEIRNFIIDYAKKLLDLYSEKN